MPRSLRIEYPDAIYHVMNRGNYRHDIFGVDGSKQAFEETLFGACERTGWCLHAFCLLDNHFHLALQTPDANLAVGMQWLQSTFANRFNRLVKQRGHVFQGRYKSLVVERDEYFGPLLDYIHLNPVRAKLVDVPGLGNWRWSSMWYLSRKRQRPACLDLSTCLYYAGNLVDRPAGRQKYLDYLSWLSESDTEKKAHASEKMCRGWALGSRAFKKELMTEERARGIERLGHVSQEARELYWEGLLDQMLVTLSKTQVDIDQDSKSSTWKVMMAHYLKQHTAVTNGWLSRHLNMGVINGVSRYVAAFEHAKGAKKRGYKKMIARIKP